MKSRLLLLILVLIFSFSNFIGRSQVLYENNTPAGSIYNPGFGVDGNPIIMFDDINVASSKIGSWDSIGITQIKVAIGRDVDAPAVNVNVYVTGVDPAATSFDSLPAVPPKLLTTFELPAGGGSTLLILGDSTNPFYTIKADTGYVYTGYQTFFIGASFSSDATANGWFLSNGPDFNDDLAFQYDSLNTTEPRIVFNFSPVGMPPGPKATFYAAVYGKLFNATSPTPVTLKDFAVAKRNRQNVITWKTETENNSSYFVIERSKNGHDFYPIGQISAAGTSTSVLNYQFTDQAPLKGTNFYRLNSVDKDKKGKLSIIKSVRNYGETLLNIYPNPVTDVIKADIDAEKAGKGFVSIIDLSGKQIYKRQVEITEGVNALSFNISGVLRGTYIIKIKLNDNDVIVKKFTKQ